MSDVTVAPAGDAPPAAPSEVEINQAPVNSQNPVGTQAPEKPASDKPPSRREAIQAAFDRANNPKAKEREAPKPAPKAAEAKPGHNKPPEETEGIDLKKRPQDQPRGERGQYAPREQSAQNPVQTPANAAQKSANAQLPETAPYRDPPQRMSDKAKADWGSTPETVRGDVHRIQQEFEGAYRKFRGDHETMNSIRQYHDMATQHGTTLDRALSNYVTMEQKLRQDVVGGLDIIVNNLNLRTPDGQRLGLRDIAHYVLNQSPEQHKLTQQSNATSAAQHQIGALHQELQGLKSTLQEMHTAVQFTHTRSAVDQYAEAHPRFDELGDLIENELKLGFDLDTAYRRAELLRPATRAAQTRTPTSAQTRTIDRSISGAPDAGPSNGTSRRNEKPVGRRDAVRNAISRVQGGV
jgi:hypothetical protein